MAERKKIILVDDDLTSLLRGKEALSGAYEVLTVSSGTQLFEALGRFQPDMILLDAELPKMDGFEILRRLKANPKSQPIPVILTTAREDAACHERAIRLGATDIVLKPYIPALLVLAVQRQLLLSEQHAQLKEYEQRIEGIMTARQTESFLFQDVLLSTLAAISDNKTLVTAPERIGTLRAYLTALTNRMRSQNVYAKDMVRVFDEVFLSSALLHDVGKIIVQDSILQKPGRLTPDEFEAVKRHTTFGVKIIEQIERNAAYNEFFNHAKLFASYHHEHFDGSGYPFRMRGESIPLHGRLMAIVDVYDALVSERPYKTAISHEKAREIIAASAGTHFDPQLVKVFLDASDEFADIRRTANMHVLAAKGVQHGS